MNVDEEYTAYVSARLPWLRKIAYPLCQDWHRADDLVQTAITRLYVKWRQARAADDLDAYVRTMLIRVFLAEQRGGWFSRVRLTSAISHQPSEGGDRDMAMDVSRALAAVPPRQRATLVLRFHCDLSVEQTARALGCSTGTVKSQTARGLAALRAMLGEQESRLVRTEEC
ncbi:RNA polymerase sigma-70 factor (sigma-E family) [Thermocatellispora tengchongensis]|uniref:RNA polymerase sigma-70 factor (Sigma-E family) n=1 Tax=Thermocatellispora tengchongensis TaxID=1073253 RepID=A0A840PDV7_9ACTN|nr:SigE family RNA polymerase sigma factor [Thermocatellispora tengchongensis]MBB5137798.1 RNA polymerase sigma-70 factor (sigma-E family) [Thermocatellispora tengchongensis]